MHLSKTNPSRVSVIAFAAAAIAVAMLALALFTTNAVQPAGVAAVESAENVPMGASFTADADPKMVMEVIEQLHGRGGDNHLHNWSTHWNVGSTALGEGGSNQGDPVRLTWSIIPDGTAMPSQFAQDTTCNSNLIADFNAEYGAGNWEAEFQRVFDDWSALTGSEYVREPNDDGANWPNSTGVDGVRGDLRIGGCTIDGDGPGILAFNFFPSNGDMKIDTAHNSFFDGTLSPDLHNVFSHEHGHGAGISHICSSDSRFLMEPFIDLSFLGLQHDDIRAVQRGYGDRYEQISAAGGVNSNDSLGSATSLTYIIGTQYVDQLLSIDDNGDQDWFAVDVPDTCLEFTATIEPIGFVYDDSDQNQFTGACASGNPIDSSIIHNLDVALINADGSPAADAGDAAIGSIDTETGTFATTGTNFIQVTGSGTDDVQLYDIRIDVDDSNCEQLAVDMSNMATSTPEGNTSTSVIGIAVIMLLFVTAFVGQRALTNKE